MKPEVKCYSKAGIYPTKSENSALGNRKGHQKSNKDKGTSTRNQNFRDAFNRLRTQFLENTAADKVSIGVNDVDDAEISGYLNNKEEMLLKKIMWEATNKKYLKESQLKAARKKKKATAPKNADKTSGAKEDKKSSKINYDVLKRLMDEPEEVSKELDGNAHPGHGYNTEQPNDNSIPEAHESSGSHEDNYRYKNENGHTNHRDTDDYYYGGDMYGEYENYGYNYVEEKDEDGFDYAEDYDA